jgi:glycosyltransferase involved in cell wall biosynthesis
MLQTVETMNVIDDPRAVDADEAKLLGRIDHCHGRTLVGWAAVSERLGERVTLELLIDGETIIRTIANRHRADIEAAGVGDGHFGFEIAVPAEYCDAAPHVLAVRDVATGIFIDGSPVQFLADAIGDPSSIAEEILPRPHGMFIDGFLDECLPGGIVGWAARRDGSHFPVEIELLVDSVPTTRAIAELHRADLNASGIGNGHHGFRLVPPDAIFDDRPHAIEVREVSTQEVLEHGTDVIRFNPCQLWASSGNAEHRRRRALADAALTYCEAAADNDLGDGVHQILLQLQSWLQSQPHARNERRVQQQLNRLTALRCQLMMSGFVNIRQIGGSIVDSWGEAQPTELELVETDSTSAETGRAVAAVVSAGGSFVCTLPNELFDDDIHCFALRVKPFGGALGPWSFLLSSSTRGDQRSVAPLVYNPMWDTVPAAISLRRIGEIQTPSSQLDLVRFALQDALENDSVDPTSASEIVRIRCELGSLLLTAGEWSEALTEFESAAGTDSCSVEAIVGQVKCLLAIGDEAAAECLVANSLQAFPDSRELYELDDELRGHKRPKQVRLVAFYLPQFHPIPENNEWWGKGFTEWANVAAAKPLFDGHLQPRRPTSLGFYDLRLPEAANAQFELARRYGIDGFCYYFYWFNGRRILERPLQDLASGRTGPFPFCICWANEPWTRSWDGVTGEVLLAQNHTPESDFEFIKDVAPLLRHKDYIRVEGKPIVMVYRADKLATPQKTVGQWRDWCRTEGIGELHLCAVQSFGFHDPRPFGFDAAVEFPPHCPATVYPDYDYHQEIQNIPGRVEGFRAKVFSYQVFASGDMRTPREPFTLHRSAMVAWDNTPRRQKAAHVFHDFSVATFERWVLNNSRKAAIEQRDAVCFINAWNEWAEGSVMEPDAHFGYEILEASRRAKRMANFDSIGTYWRNGYPQFPEDRLAQRQRIVLVGHDAFPSGAQRNLLNMARTLKRQLDIDVIIMLIDGGDLLEDYERVAPTFVIGREEGWRTALQYELRRHRPLGARKAICNTVVTGEVAEVLKQEGYRVVSLVHELPALIESYDLSGRCWALGANADNIVFASRLVADEFCSRYWPDAEKIAIAPQGISFNPYHGERDSIRLEVREELGLPPSSVVILGCGHGDMRKGIDLFVQMAAEVARQCEPGAIAFVWIGPLEWQLAPYIQGDIARLHLADVFRVTGQTADPARYFIAGDLFALTSREDPFPSVVMEAFDAKLPVVAFAGGGGYVDIVNEKTGALVPYLDVASMVSAVLIYCNDRERRICVGDYNHTLSREHFGYEQYLKKVLALLSDVPASQITAGRLTRQAWFSDRPRPTITAIVPNYNYARYLELRLRTIIEQTLPPDEIIVLDDASTDSSLELIRAMAEHSRIPIHLVTNKRNTGNPFVQWADGLSRAKSDLVWIAEADDYCEPTLLETLAREFTDERVVMAWSDSTMVDESGCSEGAQYKDYYSQNYGARWYMSFRTEGRRLIDDCLLAENVVPNASAVLFRRKAVKQTDLHLIKQYRFSGDWWFWLSIAQEGHVAYNARPLNYHRRHSRSVMGEVLRAGESLIPETISFYSRVTLHKPECVTRNARAQALNRLQRLFEMFPSLRMSASRVSDHPSLMTQCHELTQGFAQAIVSRGFVQDRGVALVLSHDVLRPDMRGDALVRYVDATTTLISLIVVAPEREAAAFIESLQMPNIAHVVIPPDTVSSIATSKTSRTSTAEQHLHALLGKLSFDSIVSHGLLAHCLVRSITRQNGQEWLLVAGKEFDSLLGHPPKDAGVTVAGVLQAVSSCTEAQFCEKLPPHAFARMAQACARPIDQLVLGTVHPRRRRNLSKVPMIRCIGLAPHASTSDWKKVAQALTTFASGLVCKIHLRLLTWGEAIEGLESLQTIESEGLKIELVQIFDRPTSLPLLGELLLVPDTVNENHRSQLKLELQGSPMRVFWFESDLSPSVGAHYEDLFNYIRELIDVSMKRLPTADSIKALPAAHRE